MRDDDVWIDRDNRATDRERYDAAYARVAPAEQVKSPRFTFRIEGSMWVYTDSVTGEERAFHGAELSGAWEWKDSIVAKEQAEQKAEAA